MSRLTPTWILVLTQLSTLILASPIYAPQFLPGGTGRNIRHLPCVSLRTGETGVCMFAFTCVKANGTHLGTCIDRFYFGSCCKLNDEPQIYPEDNAIDEGPAVAGGFVTTDSAIESNDIPDYFTRPKPLADKRPVSSTPSSSASKIAEPSTTTSTVRPSTESHKVTERPFSTPYTTTQPPMGLSTFQTLHNYSQHGSNAATTENILKVTSTAATRPKKPSTSTESSTVVTTGGSFRPRPSSTTSTSKRPVVLETTPKRPTSVHATKPAATRKPVITSTQRPASTTLRTPPSTRFPPRNATTTTAATTTTTSTTASPTTTTTTARPAQLTTAKKPGQNSGTRRPTVTTRRPGTATRKPVTTSRPSSVISTTSGPTNVTQRPVSTSVKVTQTTGPPVTSESSTTAPTKPSSSSSTGGGSTLSRPSQRPVTRRPTTGSDKVTTLKPSTTTSRPSTTTPRSRPSSRPTKPSAKPTATRRPTTVKTTSKPLQTTTERAKPLSSSSSVPSTSSSRPSTSRPSSPASSRPKPTERPTKPLKATKPPRPSSTTITAPTSTSPGTSSSTQASTSVATSSTFNGSTLTNEILPQVGSGTTATTTERATTHSPGLVTWSSNSDDDVTKAPEISSSTVATTQEEVTEPEWSPITTPDGWIMIQSPTTEKPVITDEAASRPKPTKTTTTTARPTSASTTTERVTTPTRPTIPTMLSTIATVTTATDLPVPMETLNMSDYQQVCGRRLFPESRIVGGENSTFGKWPWQISLRQWRTKAYLHKCGAALLNENWAITAAHCVENVPPSDLLLRIGEHDLANEDEPYGFQERRVQIVASHPQFDPRTFEYDLALLRFYEPLEPFQPNILPVCLPDDDENYVGHSAFVTGWGRLFEDGPLPSVLQEVSVPVINNTVCEGMYRNAGYIEHIPHIFICAGWRKGGFDSCEGDSGGPMVIRRPRDKRWILAGVISWGIGCAEPNQPGVYTRISEFREWINQILQF